MDDLPRASEMGYPPNTCRVIYPHGDKQRVCCRVMGHDGAHSPRDRDRFPDHWCDDCGFGHHPAETCAEAAYYRSLHDYS